MRPAPLGCALFCELGPVVGNAFLEQSHCRVVTKFALRALEGSTRPLALHPHFFLKKCTDACQLTANVEERSQRGVYVSTLEQGTRPAQHVKIMRTDEELRKTLSWT